MPFNISLPQLLRPRLSAAWRSIKYYSIGLYLELTAKHVFLWAQAIAFKVLVTIVPIVILATGIVGRVLRQKDSFAEVSRFIRELLPATQSQQLINFLNQLQNASATIVGIGGIGLFLSALSLFITLRIAVSNAFEQTWHKQRSLFRGYLFDTRMVIQVGLLFLLTVGLSVSLPDFINDVVVHQLGENKQWIQQLWDQTIWITGLLLPLLLTTAMFFQLYYFVPKPHPQKRSALAGAAIAAILWETAKQAFAFYATYIGYGTGTEALGNTFGLIVAFVFWVYFSGIVLMIGAVIASLREHRRVTSGQLPQTDYSSDLHTLLEDASSPAHGPPDSSTAEGAEENPSTPASSLDEPVPSTPPSSQS